jgi:hypothetical protein
VCGRHDRPQWRYDENGSPGAEARSDRDLGRTHVVIDGGDQRRAEQRRPTCNEDESEDAVPTSGEHGHIVGSAARKAPARKVRACRTPPGPG